MALTKCSLMNYLFTRLYGKSSYSRSRIQSSQLVPVRKSCRWSGIFFPAGGYELGLLDEALSIAFITAAFKIKCRSAAAKLVLVSLADNFNFESGLCCPSITTIAKRCDLTRRSVIRTIKQLESDGLILVTRKLRRPNRYKFVFPPASDVVSPPSDRRTPAMVTQSHPNRKGTRNNQGRCFALSKEPPKSTASPEALRAMVEDLRSSAI